MTAVSWLKAASGTWATPSDWSTSAVPVPGDDVFISIGGSYTVTITALQIFLNSLTISDTSATLAVDTGGLGGSNILLTGALSNIGRIQIGNATETQAVTVTAVGLTNTGEIDLTGNSTVQTSLLVETAAPATLVGKFLLSGDAMLAYTSGAITAIGNGWTLSLTGSKARVALASAQGSNSALTTLGSNFGTLRLESGASVSTTVDLANNGTIDVDDNNGSGGSRLTIGGTLTNRSKLVIGNSFLTAGTTVKATNLVNASEIDLTGSGANQATLLISAPAPVTFTGINKLTGDALLEYSSGSIHNIVIGSTLVLNGRQARVAVAAATGSNSALIALAGNAGTLDLENGASVGTNVNFTNTGTVDVDFTPGAGGSLLGLGPVLLTNQNRVQIGNAALSALTIVRAKSLSNPGEIDITGAASVEALLNITGPAPGTLSGGTYKLTNDAVLQFASGAITGIFTGTTLSLNGSVARVAITSTPNSNSALTTLANVAGTLMLSGGAHISTTAGLSNTGSVQVDSSGTGGSRLTIGGTLTNNAIAPNGIKIGNAGLTAAAIVTAGALSNTGELDITGARSVAAQLIAGGAAPATLTGTNKLVGDALLQYASGAVTAIGIGSTLLLNGPAARVALATSPGTNSALTMLATNSGTLDLENGAVIATTTSLQNTGLTNVDISGGAGGSRLTIAGTLTNSAGALIKIGNATLSAATVVKAAALSNSGEIDLTGVRSVQATLNITAAAPATLTGTNKLVGDALLEYASGAITAIGAGTTLLLSGASARVAVAATLGSNSALTALASNAGSLDLENGAALTISAGFDNTSGTMKVDTTSAGGSTLTIGATFSNGGNVTIGSNALSQTTSVNAAALQNLTGAKINIVGFAAPAMLTLAGASTDAGSIEVDGAGVLALGNTLTVTGTVNLNGGTISGGSLAGAGTMSSTKLSSSTLDGVTIASGANFTAGASSILTLDNVIVSGAVQGGGSAALRFGLAGSDAMTSISGFPLVMLGNGGANDLSLTDANFVAVPSTMTAGLTENFITIDGGNSGNTIDSSALTGTNAIAAYAGPGTDTITGGAGNDAFFAGGNTSMTGNGGTNVFVFAATGVTNQITDFAASVSNEIALSNFGFALGLGNSTATPQPLPAALIGGLTAGTFTTSAQRFAYNQSTGQLLFDADGNGAASSQVVATLTGDPVVNASQLFFVA